MKKIDFCEGWQFKKQGEENAVLVNLPHDAMILESRNPGNPSGSAGAFFKGGVYEYEKTFTVSGDWRDKYIAFQFEGVYKNAKVFINGNEAGGKPYGYIPFFIDTEGLLNYGGENTIRVVADNSDMPNSRWYTGAGIYRPVWIWAGAKNHIEAEGVKITTLSHNPARIRVDTAHTGGDIDVEILYDGKSVAKGAGDSAELDIPNAKLWSDETPHLYQCRVTLSKDDVAVDGIEETFGIRTVEWSIKGLFINGKETLLRGGCVHHDNGILGARSYAKSEDRRVRIMKEAGFNAIRSAHNPASKAMLEACDRYGVYMMDETWDMWYGHKNKFDYANDFETNYKYDIKAMVDRDYNHPSVIMYSIANEVSEPYQEKGVNLAKEMTDYIHSLDKTRAVTAGINLMIINMASKGKGIYKEGGGRDSDSDKKEKSGSLFFNMMTSMVGTFINKSANSKKADTVTTPVLDILDIAGYNYCSGRYKKESKLHPNRILVGSETFPQDIAKNWETVKKYSYLIGDFMWTGWDYLGEAGIGAWSYTPDGAKFDKPYPWLLADAGAVDITGYVGAEAAYAAVVWGLRGKPFIGVQPVNRPGMKPYRAVWRGTNATASWSWKNCEGNKAVVEVYAAAASVELLLNGKSLGKKKIKRFKTAFTTAYAPGTLTAIAYGADGGELSRSSLTSADGKTRICVQAEDEFVKEGDIAYVNVSLVGENCIVESNADTKLTVSVDGGELLAFGSANPRTEDDYNSGSFTAYYGRAQAVVRAGAKTVIRVGGEGLDSVSVALNGE
ncbi:MAG: DUF4982 domain-containing protein [Oscillospiraceae bacterium]|nr:DUF4982 domain-containing protein [Oscillospiraceae bacterium]